MEIDQTGIDFIRQEEGERLTVYRDSRGLPTVGVGHLVQPEDGLQVGDTITQAQSDAFLVSDIAAATDCIANRVTVPLTQHQYDALCSLIYNIGVGAFLHSTVLADLNASNYDGAADAFLMWKNAGGRPILLGRRERERTLFLTPDTPDPLTTATITATTDTTGGTQ
jgi:lysozyme